ncbi:adenylyl-sulfate kinase [Nocardia sp. NPDC050793]|uniref:adenylyl-sulfate kinase n=1 Tax=Nocardia sp. NPDC050793 TaxID=3155159 RepID=UPI0033C253F8
MLCGTVWLTGLPSSGKTTLAAAVCRGLGSEVRTEHFDGDVVRAKFFPELGFAEADRRANIRRIGELSMMVARHGVLAVVSAISPYRDARADIRAAHAAAGLAFIEVHVDPPLAVCIERDVKGLYRRAADGQISDMTGVQSTYEAPISPELRLDTSMQSIERCVTEIIDVAEQAMLSARRGLSLSPEAGAGVG